MTGNTYDRYGAECAPEAGAVPCNLIDFHNIENPQDLVDRVKALLDHVMEQCSATYAAKWEAWYARYHNAVICPVNECKTGEATCHELAKCVDIAVGYDCICKQHYEGDGYTTCTPIDYCAQNGICPAYSDCINLDPGYKCDCRQGYQKQGNKCVPINPCTVNNGGCSAHAFCRSKLEGSTYNHFCTCKTGYYGDGFTCEPIDPCEVNNCDENANCIPYSTIQTEADYNCRCKSGYSGNGFICNEIVDPCAGVSCGTNASKKIVKTGYQESCICQCNVGYAGDGQNCEPLDPCNGNDCDVNAQCLPDIDYGYKCRCKLGFSGDGKSCKKDNPCDECHANAICDNYTKVCKCKNGFVGDGFECRRPDSCARACPSGTKCDDGECMCTQAGYVYDFGSYSCKDINECKTGRHNCNENAHCKNLDGGFRCTCKKGFTGDGVSCHEQNNEDPYAGGNPYSDQNNDVEAPTPAPVQTGIDISIYSELSDGECSTMGFDWENLSKMLYKMSWVTYNKDQQVEMVKEIFDQFANLGKSALTRSGPQCDMRKAGVVPCNFLYFPHKEHRCQLVKRMARIFADVAKHCNKAWTQVYGQKMNYLLQQNKSGKQGTACPKVNWLP